MAEARIVTFDLMTDDPDYYFVLTEALRDFAARERAEAEHDDDKAAFRIRLAEAAEGALDRIEAALSGQSRRPGCCTCGCHQQAIQPDPCIQAGQCICLAAEQGDAAQE